MSIATDAFDRTSNVAERYKFARYATLRPPQRTPKLKKTLMFSHVPVARPHFNDPQFQRTYELPKLPSLPSLTVPTHRLQKAMWGAAICPCSQDMPSGVPVGGKENYDWSCLY